LLTPGGLDLRPREKHIPRPQAFTARPIPGSYFMIKLKNTCEVFTKIAYDIHMSLWRK